MRRPEPVSEDFAFLTFLAGCAVGALATSFFWTMVTG